VVALLRVHVSVRSCLVGEERTIATTGTLQAHLRGRARASVRYDTYVRTDTDGRLVYARTTIRPRPARASASFVHLISSIRRRAPAALEVTRHHLPRLGGYARVTLVHFNNRVSARNVGGTARSKES
jgi:hypothetical protein